MGGDRSIANSRGRLPKDIVKKGYKSGMRELELPVYSELRLTRDLFENGARRIWSGLKLAAQPSRRNTSKEPQLASYDEQRRIRREQAPEGFLGKEIRYSQSSRATSVGSIPQTTPNEVRRATLHTRYLIVHRLRLQIWVRQLFVFRVSLLRLFPLRVAFHSHTSPRNSPLEPHYTPGPNSCPQQLSPSGEGLPYEGTLYMEARGPFLIPRHDPGPESQNKEC
jgi:hypothetical protein